MQKLHQLTFCVQFSSFRPTVVKITRSTPVIFVQHFYSKSIDKPPQRAYTKNSFCNYSQIAKAAIFAKTNTKFKKNKHTQKAKTPIRAWHYLSLKAMAKLNSESFFIAPPDRITPKKRHAPYNHILLSTKIQKNHQKTPLTGAIFNNLVVQLIHRCILK